MLTSLSFLCAQRKGAPDYSPETREQPVALLAQPASNERPLLEGEPLSLCSDLLRFSVAIPTVSSEGQKLKIFVDTPRSLCRGSLLFTEVPRRGILRSWLLTDSSSIHRCCLGCERGRAISRGSFPFPSGCSLPLPLFVHYPRRTCVLRTSHLRSSRKFRCRIMHRLPLRATRMASKGLHAARINAGPCTPKARRGGSIAERQIAIEKLSPVRVLQRQDAILR